MDAVEEVKARISIEDVIAEYVQLKRAGRNFKGLSPFGNEKTASFMVSPEKQIWHDFSTGKGGDIFTFVMEMEGLDFRATLELLARKAGVDLEKFGNRSGGNSKLKERLYDANEQAAKFYQVHFSRSQLALEYVFKKRKFTKEIALKFRIGYSPNNGTALYDYLRKKGFKDNELIDAGLVVKRYRGPSDMFRGRLMVPLMDPQNRVVGFTARLLEDDPEAPKYINTPQTALYDKGRHVFGLNFAKDAIRKKKYAVLVEGNLDVIASHQVHVDEVVATAGTALTEHQLKAIGRFAPEVRLAFDQDRAGLAATERAIPIAGKVGVSLLMITIPEGKDPDELIKKDPSLWQKAIDAPEYALDWLIHQHARSLDIKSAQGKRQFSDIVMAVVRQLPDSVEQDHYMVKIADMIGVSPDALRSKLQAPAAPEKRLKKPNITPEKLDAALIEQTRHQNHLLVLALMWPGLRVYLDPITEDMLTTDEANVMLDFLKNHPDFEFDGNVSKVIQADPKNAEVQNLADYVKILLLQYEALYQDLEDIELALEAARMQVRLIEQYVKRKKAELSNQMQGADDDAIQALLGQVKQLDQILKKTMET